MSTSSEVKVEVTQEAYTGDFKLSALLGPHPRGVRAIGYIDDDHLATADESGMIFLWTRGEVWTINEDTIHIPVVLLRIRSHSRKAVLLEGNFIFDFVSFNINLFVL